MYLTEHPRWNNLHIWEVAQRQWSNQLEAFHAIHWYCSQDEDAKRFAWDLYDPIYHPTIPSLNTRFIRSICTSPFINPIDEHKLLNVCTFYMKTNSQMLYVSKLSSDTICFILKNIKGITDAKPIEKNVALIYK